MADFPDIPAIQPPSLASIATFLAIILFVVFWFVISVYRSGDGFGLSRRRRTAWFAVALLVWLAIGAALPLSGLLHQQILPPPGLIFAIACFVAGIAVAFSRIGTTLTALPIYWLVGFQAFRLPLELVLHNWYESGSIPVQMTFAGYNFDIASGILALAVAAWAKYGSPPKLVIVSFNVIGMALLLTVVSIAITSVPTPFRQFTTEPPLLLPFYFPYSYIVSVAVTGALIVHLILFRKLNGARGTGD